MNRYQVAYLNKASEIETSLTPDEFVKIVSKLSGVFDSLHVQPVKVWQFDGAWIPIHGVHDTQLRLLPLDVGEPDFDSDYEQLGKRICDIYEKLTIERKSLERYQAKRLEDRKRLSNIEKKLELIDCLVDSFTPESWRISFDRIARKGHKQVNVWLELSMSESRWKREWSDLKLALGKLALERVDKTELALFLQEAD